MGRIKLCWDYIWFGCSTLIVACSDVYSHTVFLLIHYVVAWTQTTALLMFNEMKSVFWCLIHILIALVEVAFHYIFSVCTAIFCLSFSRTMVSGGVPETFWHGQHWLTNKICWREEHKIWDGRLNFQLETWHDQFQN